MPTEWGIIEKTDKKRAVVRVQKNSACSHCESRGMCHTDNGRDMVIEVENLIGAVPGDRVEIMVPTGSFMKISLMVYMLPVLAFLFGAFLGDNIARKLSLNPSAAAILSGIGLMVIFFYLLKRFDRTIGGKQKYMPRMTRRVGHTDNIEGEACDTSPKPS